MTSTAPSTTATFRTLHLSLTALALGLIALGVGCYVTTPHHPTLPIEEAVPGQRYHGSMSSIEAPTDVGWARHSKSDGYYKHIFFLKKTASPSHHLIADMLEMKVTPPVESLDEVRTHIIHVCLNRYLGSEDYKVINDSLVPSERWGATGYKANLILHDYQAPGRGDKAYLIMRLRAYIMRHPQDRDLFIIVAYQERGHREELSPDRDFEASAEAFIATLQLHDSPSDR